MNSIGLDLGFRQTKITTDKYHYKFPSLIGNPSIFEIDEFSIEKDILDSLELKYEEETYYIGARANDTGNARLCIDTDKTNSINEKVIYKTVLGILQMQERINSKISIITGLPIEDFKQAGLKEKMISNMTGEHIFTFRGEDIKSSVQKVIVMPQGAGAYYDYILDDDGNIKDEITLVADGLIVVIDVGYKTTDVVAMIKGNYDSRRSFTLYKGMKDIHNELGKLIRFNYNRKFDLAQLDDICKNSFFTHNGTIITIAELINKATKPIAEYILTEVNANIGDCDSANKVIGVGGTMALLSPFFETYYKNIFIEADDIEFANSNGYKKYGKLMNESNN